MGAGREEWRGRKKRRYEEAERVESGHFFFPNFEKINKKEHMVQNSQGSAYDYE